MPSLFRKHPVKVLSNCFASSDNYLKSRLPTWKEVLVIIIIFFLLLISLLFFITYNQKIKSEGALVQLDGQIKLISPISGTVLPYKKKQGDNINVGEEIFIVTNEIINPSVKKFTQNQLKDIANEVKLLESNNIASNNNNNSLKKLYEQNLGNLNNEKRSLLEEKQLLKTKLKLSIKNFKKWENAATKGIVSKLSIYDKEKEQYNLQIQIKQSERALSIIQSKKNNLENKLELLPTDLISLKLEYTKRKNILTEKLEQLGLAKQSVLNSPITGQISTINIKGGETVEEGQLLGIISNTESVFEVMLTILSTSSGLLKVGDPVVITIPSFPYQEFGYFKGEIKLISNLPMLTEELKKYNITNNTGIQYYKVITTINNQVLDKKNNILQFRSGMKVNAEIILEKKRLIDWFIEPIKKVQKRLATD